MQTQTRVVGVSGYIVEGEEIPRKYHKLKLTFFSQKNLKKQIVMIEESANSKRVENKRIKLKTLNKRTNCKMSE